VIYDTSLSIEQIEALTETPNTQLLPAVHCPWYGVANFSANTALLAMEFTLDVSLLALEFTPGAGFFVSLPGVGGG